MSTLQDAPEWAEVREHNARAPFFIAGDDFEEFMRSEVETYTQISRDLGILD